MIFKTHQSKIQNILKRIEAQVFYDGICGNTQSTTDFYTRSQGLQLFYPILESLHAHGYTPRMEVIYHNQNAIRVNITVDPFQTSQS